MVLSHAALADPARKSELNLPANLEPHPAVVRKVPLGLGSDRQRRGTLAAALAAVSALTSSAAEEGDQPHLALHIVDDLRVLSSEIAETIWSPTRSAESIGFDASATLSVRPDFFGGTTTSSKERNLAALIGISFHSHREMAW